MHNKQSITKNGFKQYLTNTSLINYNNQYYEILMLKKELYYSLYTGLELINLDE